MVQCDTGQIVGLGFINIKSANSLLWCHTLIYPNKLANRAKHFKTKNAFFYKSIEITYRKVLTIHLKQRDYCSMKTKWRRLVVIYLGWHYGQVGVTKAPLMTNLTIRAYALKSTLGSHWQVQANPSPTHVTNLNKI